MSWLHHIALPVDDVDAAESFYLELAGALGLQFVVVHRALTADGARRGVWLARQQDIGPQNRTQIRPPIRPPITPQIRPQSPVGSPAFSELRCGGPMLVLEQRPTSGTHREPPCLAFSIAPAQRDEVQRWLETHGLELHHQSKFTLYTSDPWRNPIAFSHHPDSSV